MTTHSVLIAGDWRPARATGTFTAFNPALGEPLPGEFPISDWADCDAALDAATAAAAHLRTVPPETRALFLEAFARRIEVLQDELVETAHAETGLPKAPRLAEVELPRTTAQLRQGAAAVRDGSWALPTIDTKLNIRSLLAPIGPVLVFGPNNFPFAFNSVAGGDFVAAIAAGNPVIAKANTSHPGTTRLLAEEAADAALRVVAQADRGGAALALGEIDEHLARVADLAGWRNAHLDAREDAQGVEAALDVEQRRAAHRRHRGRREGDAAAHRARCVPRGGQGRGWRQSPPGGRTGRPRRLRDGGRRALRRRPG